MALIQPQNSHNFIGEDYQIALNNSIQNLLDSIQEPSFEISTFLSNFQELLKVKHDPPLETIWVYSALAFKNLKNEKDEILEQVLAVKSLFHVITSCSASCSSLKNVALVGPVVYEVCKVVGKLKEIDSGSKNGKKVVKEIKSLVDGVLGYVNVCVCDNVGYGGELIRPLVDLVGVWLGDTVSEIDEKERSLRGFFPLLSDVIVGGLSGKECDVCELAGVVTAEAFLLRMCLEFREGVSRKVLQEELRVWAVGSVTGFKNVLFFETLVKMLLEPTLPVTSLLSSEDEIIMRKVLYDVVILPEYSFLKPDRLTHQPVKQSLTIARLMVTYEATETYRKDGDHAKSISYINAFSASHIPAELIKWVKDETGMGNKSSGPNGYSPKAVLKWIYDLEDQGINILDKDMSKYRARLMINSLETDNEQPDSITNGKKSDNNVLFYFDNKGDEEMNEDIDDKNKPISDAFMAAAHSLQSVESVGKRKRKERKGSEKKHLKFRKHSINEISLSSGDMFPSFEEDNSSSEAEVENLTSDDESED
ncbi:DNA ligase 4 [Heracleum sosnowskyi]|uniref:DNA ligase 4 n=1 Tax=Heracleum sosnowskyi TaxID=360622 RepID=A0AAD8GTA1_9APIA|nr:DNA ligase 4 [Heracleum sosnowskyi]